MCRGYPAQAITDYKTGKMGTSIEQVVVSWG